MDNQKVILITGASAGIGKDAARTLIQQGYTVYAAARRVDKMEDLKQLGGLPLKMDITSEEEVTTAFETIRKKHGGVDILINNAGFAHQGPVEEVTIDEARYQFEVNLFGLARVTQKAIPYMREQGAGKIINISSAGGKVYFALGAWYISTKHALEGWSDCLRLELKPFGIDVVIIEPGAIATEFNDVSVDPLVERYGAGPYGDKIRAFVEFNKKNDANPANSSPPSVITDVIVKAIRARRPKIRYVAGAMAKPIIFLRRWGGDRFFDWMINRMVG